MINLNKIQNNFNRASRSYDSVANVQKQTAYFLIEKLLTNKNFNPQTILDLGTGTGYIPEFLLPIYPESHYYLNDIAQNMLNICKQKFSIHPKFTYLHSHMAMLDKTAFDLVISNLALQWVDNLWNALELFHMKSKQFFAFSTLLKGTFKEWETQIQQYQHITLNSYPEEKELVHYCNALDNQSVFNYWVMDFPLSFDTAFSFMRYLKLLGASANNEFIQLKNLHKLLKDQKDSLIVSYKVFFGIFKKDPL